MYEYDERHATQLGNQMRTREDSASADRKPGAPLGSFGRYFPRRVGQAVLASFLLSVLFFAGAGDAMERSIACQLEEQSGGSFGFGSLGQRASLCSDEVLDQPFRRFSFNPYAP